MSDSPREEPLTAESSRRVEPSAEAERDGALPAVAGEESQTGAVAQPDPADRTWDPDAERTQRREAREAERHSHPQGMVPGRERRRFAVERVFVRLIATGGIVAIAVVLGAILVSQDVAGWTVGLVIGLVTVVLAALLWSSREL